MVGKKPRKGDLSDLAVDSALRLAAERGWERVSLADVAADTDIPLADVLERFPNRTRILTALLARTDRRVIEGWTPDDAEDETPRDRLFDLLMRRFDALAPHKRGLAAIVNACPSDLGGIAGAAPRFFRSMAWMLEAAGLSASGARGCLRVQGLALIYLGAFRVWLGDDTDDMARTMAALDKGLMRAENLITMARGRRHPVPPGEATGEAPGDVVAGTA